MSDNTRESYLRWLEPQLGFDGPSTYWGVTNLMFDQEFGLGHPMDHNRLNDGLDLRRDFFSTNRIPEHQIYYPCSFLEVLIGLSRRMAFVAGGDAPDWALQLMANLEFDKARDSLTRHKQDRVLTTMARVISRTYDPSGLGGFFPLAQPDRDQRQVELWYQLNSYVEELQPG